MRRASIETRNGKKIVKGTRIRNVTRIEIGIKMRKNQVQRTKIVTIRTRNTSPVPKIKTGKIEIEKRIKRGIETKIKIGIRANTVRRIRTRIVTVAPKINIGIRTGTKTNIPETRIGRIEKEKVTYIYIYI